MKGQQKWGWVAPFAVCLLILLTALGVGIYVDGYGLHPPAQFTGICPPPAQITKGECYVSQVQIITVNGVATQTIVQLPAGYILTTSTTSTGTG